MIIMFSMHVFAVKALLTCMRDKMVSKHIVSFTQCSLAH
jgi:hypothetical protein